MQHIALILKLISEQNMRECFWWHHATIARPWIIVRMVSSVRLHHFGISKEQRLSIIRYFNRKKNSSIILTMRFINRLLCFVKFSSISTYRYILWQRIRIMILIDAKCHWNCDTAINFNEDNDEWKYRKLDFDTCVHGLT